MVNNASSLLDLTMRAKLGLRPTVGSPEKSVARFTVRIDPDLVQWIRQIGQRRFNAVLRQSMELDRPQTWPYGRHPRVMKLCNRDFASKN